MKFIFEPGGLLYSAINNRRRGAARQTPHGLAATGVWHSQQRAAAASCLPTRILFCHPTASPRPTYWIDPRHPRCVCTFPRHTCSRDGPCGCTRPRRVRGTGVDRAGRWCSLPSPTLSPPPSPPPRRRSRYRTRSHSSRAPSPRTGPSGRASGVPSTATTPGQRLLHPHLCHRSDCAPLFACAPRLSRLHPHVSFDVLTGGGASLAGLLFVRVLGPALNCHFRCRRRVPRGHYSSVAAYTGVVACALSCRSQR